MNARAVREQRSNGDRTPDAVVARDPSEYDPEAVLALQRTAGNQAVARLMTPGPTVQARGVPRTRPFDLRRSGSGAALGPATRERLEGGLGRSLADVRVHEDGQAERAGAHALTAGSHIHFARGRYEPSSTRGLELLAHETAHVVQQRDGRLPASTGAVVSDPGLESEADSFAAAVRSGPAGPSPAPLTAARSGAAPREGTVAQPVEPVTAGVFLTLGAEAWGIAGTVVGIVTAGIGVGGGVATVVAPGSNAVASYVLPQNVMSEGDKEKLQLIAQFKIISQYVRMYLDKHHDIRDEINGTTPAPEAEPEQAPAPAREPDIEGLDEMLLDTVKIAVARELQATLERDVNETEHEFMWGEDDVFFDGPVGSRNRPPEAFGVTGYLRFHNVQSAAIATRLELTGLTAAERGAVGGVPEEGKLAIARRFTGGSMDGDATWSMHSSVAVNVLGGQAQLATRPDGAPELIIRTGWDWSRFGPDTQSKLETRISVTKGGQPIITSEREGSP